VLKTADMVKAAAQAAAIRVLLMLSPDESE